MIISLTALLFGFPVHFLLLVFTYWAQKRNIHSAKSHNVFVDHTQYILEKIVCCFDKKWRCLLSLRTSRNRTKTT